MSAESRAVLLLCMAGLAALCACGQSGPLMLPEPAQAEPPAADEDQDESDTNGANER